LDNLGVILNRKLNLRIGAFSGRDKKIVLAVVNNYGLKRLEDIVLGVDANALMIMENTFNVLGKGFSKPKVY
jgi:uncharacterized membrane-anchored protein YitT (DUF2179 family)